MKKPLALLLTALLLIPALAMAEPKSFIDPSVALLRYAELGYTINLHYNAGNHGIFTFSVKDGQYYSTYSSKGNLIRYSFTFDCGCQVNFSTDGTRTKDPVMHVIDNPSGPPSRYIWDEDIRRWMLDDKPVDLPGSTHEYSDATHKAPFKLSTIDGTRPPLTIVEAVKANKYNINSYDELMEAVKPDKFTTKYYTSNDGKHEIWSNALGMLGYFYDGKLIEWYAGSVSGQAVVHQFWLTFDNEYGINTEGKYDWDTGNLEFYKFYTADRSMNAAYSLKNVMLGCEMWDSNGWYWEFDKDRNGWVCGKDGKPDNAVEMHPTTEVLENLLHAPEAAKYTSQCVTSAQANSSSFDSEGVPYIVASGMDDVTPNITATQDSLRTTTFDITLEGGDGSSITKPDEPVSLTLAYPAGMTQNIVEKGNYEMVVVHDNSEVMSTLSGNVTLTKNGPRVTATSFSPYRVEWGTADELRAKYPGSIGGNTSSLPQTGDNSNLLLYAVLLAVCAGGLCVLLAVRKRRANR